MREIMSIIFEISTSPLEISNNPIIDYLIMGIIGIIAYKVAFILVVEIEIFGAIGSILHWTIRIFIFITCWFILSLIIVGIKFILSIPLWCWIVFGLCLILLIIIHPKKHPNSLLNKKII